MNASLQYPYFSLVNWDQRKSISHPQILGCGPKFGNYMEKVEWPMKKKRMCYPPPTLTSFIHLKRGKSLQARHDKPSKQRQDKSWFLKSKGQVYTYKRIFEGRWGGQNPLLPHQPRICGLHGCSEELTSAMRGQGTCVMRRRVLDEVAATSELMDAWHRSHLRLPPAGHCFMDYLLPSSLLERLQPEGLGPTPCWCQHLSTRWWEPWWPLLTQSLTLVFRYHET